MNERSTAQRGFYQRLIQIDGLPLEFANLLVEAARALDRSRPLFNSALALPPSERLKGTRAPRYFSLLDDLIRTEMQLMTAVCAARTEALARWCEGEGEPQEPEPRDGG